jgi:hypothetical protein
MDENKTKQKEETGYDPDKTLALHILYDSDQEPAARFRLDTLLGSETMRVFAWFHYANSIALTSFYISIVPMCRLPRPLLIDTTSNVPIALIAFDWQHPLL